MESLSSSALDPTSEDAPRPRPVWRIALACGASAAILAWIAGELAQGTFKPELVKTEVLLETFIQPTLTTQGVADSKNATLSIALLGGVMGLTMGFAGGLAGRSIIRGLVVGVSTAPITALFGFATARALLPLFFRRLVPDPNDLWTPIFVHGGIWSALAAICAVSFGIGIEASRREFFYIVLNACVAGFSASFLFHTAAEGLFPQSNSNEPIATYWGARLLAAVFVTLLMAVGAASGVAVRGPSLGSKPAT